MYTCACSVPETLKTSIAAAVQIEMREHTVEVIVASWFDGVDTTLDDHALNRSGFNVRDQGFRR
jgi:hypothetical protein